jgi:hypothetical protein
LAGFGQFTGSGRLAATHFIALPAVAAPLATASTGFVAPFCRPRALDVAIDGDQRRGQQRGYGLTTGTPAGCSVVHVAVVHGHRPFAHPE